MTVSDNTRLWIVRAGIVVGMLGLSVVALNARELGPFGRATGGATGCNAGGDVDAARDLVANPGPVDLDRTFDPERFVATGPYHAVDGQLIVALDGTADALDPGSELAAVFDELGVDEPLTPFLDLVPDADPKAAEFFANIVVVEIPGDAMKAVARLSEIEAVAWVEPVTEIVALWTPAVGRPLQWNLDMVGEPWIAENTHQGEGATVAVLDSGYLPDPQVEPGFDRSGWDFVGRDAEPLDGFGHGTLVTNLITQNAETGFSGLAPAATILTCRILDDHGRGTTLDLAAAVLHASLVDADVILMSIGGYHPSMLVSEALDYADASGAVLVAAAGNDGLQQLAFPASHPAVLSVGAVNPDLETISYTNAAEQVDLLAPGGDLTADLDGDEMVDGIVALEDGQWTAAEGTSLAAAHVAAIAAVALADTGVESHLLRRELRMGGDDRVVDAQRVIEDTRQIRAGGAATEVAGSLMAHRLHQGDFRVELAWETGVPGQTTCSWDAGEVVRPWRTAMHRVVVDLSPDRETRVVCTTTDTDGKLVERSVVVQPPSIAAASPDSGCSAISGGPIEPVRVDGDLRGSAGAVCEIAR